MSASTPELDPHPARPALRAVDPAPAVVLLPVPVCEPPYDDEREGDRGRGLVLVTASAVPVGPLRDLVPLRLVPARAELPEPPDPDVPPVRPVARALVQGLVEVLAGVRSVTQLRRRTSVELYDELEVRVQELPRHTGRRPPTGAVQSLHVQSPAPGVAEVCATVRRGSRAAAVALRLEVVDGQWCCTQLLGP